MRAWKPALRALTGPVLGVAMGLSVAAAIVLTGTPADARTSYDSAYGFDRTWNAAIRLVRVDMGLKVLEKDDATGYLMFEYKAPGGGKASSGSMEFVRTREPEAPVRVVVQLPQMPSYHEQMMVDSLVRKMRTEYGNPPPPHPKAPASPPPADAGAEGGTEGQSQP